MCTGPARPETSPNQVAHFTGDEMHSDFRMGIAGTPVVLSLTPSFTPTRRASFREEAIYGAWPLYTGVRSVAGLSTGL